MAVRTSVAVPPKVPEIRKGDTVVVLSGKDAGKRGVVDLTNMMAQYVATSIEVNAYDTHLDVGQTPLLPPMSATPLCPRT